MADKKQGILHALDLAEALHARIKARRDQLATPPCDDDDMRLVAELGHWEQLTREMLIYVNDQRRLNEVVTAQLALPENSRTHEISAAFRQAMKRLQELEIKLAGFRDASTPPLGHVVNVVQLAEEVRKAPGPDFEREPGNESEPRPSWVLEHLEALVLAGWLQDAATNLGRVHAYMVKHENRMSEDLFDELGRLSSKVEEWAREIFDGNMFPRNI